MIHFDFTVSDADAGNIMEIMRDRIMYNNVHIQKLIVAQGQEHYIDAYKRDNEYIKDLIKRMKNTQVVE